MNDLKREDLSMLSKRNKLLISSGLALFLSACGGSDNSEPVTPPVLPTTTISFSGKVIDGYVVGATVWLDFNGDGKYDQQIEPSTISGDSGDYSFEFTEEQASCVPYSTTYVDIPVGAIDLSLGEVTEAYQMSFPPSIKPISDGDIRNISPLTSIIWEQLKSQLEDKNNLTCDKLKQDNNLRYEIKYEIEDVIRNLVQYYNLSEDQIYSDFIASNDSEAYERAQSIVTGLKASYKHQKVLEKTHPNATEIRVTVYQDPATDKEQGFTDAWYRDVVVFLETGYFSEVVKLTDDESHSQVGIILQKLNRIDQPWGDQAFEGMLMVRDDIYRDKDNTYRCGTIERVSFEQNGVDYELSNSFGGSVSFESIEACLSDNVESPYERNYSFMFTEENTSYSTELYFRETNTGFTILPDWINIKEKVDMLAVTEMISYMSDIAIGWDEKVILDTAYWRKRMEYDNIVIDKDNNNKWVKSTLNEDKTRTYECSIDGVNWIACEG